MRVALISDLHGNLEAAERVVADLRKEGADRVVCLGDVSAIGPQPRETLEVVRALGCPVVMGNTDAALLGSHAEPGQGDRLRKIADLHAWAAAQLAERDREFVRGFQETVVVEGVAGGLLCCHGSPRSFEEPVLATTPDADLAEMLRGVDARLVAGGHTHLALLRRHGGGTFVNPGSVGMPCEVDPKSGRPRLHRHAEYALLTGTAEPAIEFRRVAFDPEAVRAAARRAGLPHLDWWLGWWTFR